jgi:anti-anti-sigma factor
MINLFKLTHSVTPVTTSIIQIELQYHADEAYFSLTGCLVFDSIAQIFKQYDILLKYSKTLHCIIIDCSQLEHIDSAGIALLLDWKQQLTCQQKQLRLQALSKQALALMQALNLQGFFDTDTTPT